MHAPQQSARMPREQAARILQEHGITPTQQRVEIAAILLAREQHLSAEQLLAQVNQGDAPVSKATVYNTLGLFARHGLVREVIADPSKVFYDSNTSPHHHFYDVSTGELADIPSDDIAITRLPSLPAGLELDGVDVVVRLRRR